MGGPFEMCDVYSNANQGMLLPWIAAFFFLSNAFVFCIIDLYKLMNWLKLPFVYQ